MCRRDGNTLIIDVEYYGKNSQTKYAIFFIISNSQFKCFENIKMILQITMYRNIQMKYKVKGFYTMQDYIYTYCRWRYMTKVTSVISARRRTKCTLYESTIFGGVQF